MRRLEAAEALAVLLGGIAALTFHLTLPSRLPSEADHRSAARHIAEHAQPGDAVVLFPWWTDRARLFLPESVVLVGHPEHERDPLRDHRRIWLYAQPALPYATSSGSLETLLEGRTRVGDAPRFGTIEVTLLENGRYNPPSFAASGERPTRVVVENESGETLECTDTAAGFRCPFEARAAMEWHEVSFVPRRCLFFQPPRGNRRVIAEFAGAPTGQELVVAAGLIWEFSAHRGPTMTDTVVEASLGEARASVTVPPGQSGMAEARTKIRIAEDTPLRVAVSAANPHTRQLCVEVTLEGGTR